MRHRYLCPLRWGDLDLLGHVNNVRYVDYLQEARGALLRSCLAAAGIEREEGDAYVVVRHEVTFQAPLLFGTEPAVVESWVTELRSASFTLGHEIFHEHPDGTRTVYLRARTVLAPLVEATGVPRRVTDEERTALAPYAEDGGGRSVPVRVDVSREHAAHYPVHVRFSDIDVYRHVNNVQYFEYFQEARIAVFLKLKAALKDFPRINVVVAQTDLEYVAPMVLRPEPYDCWSVVSRIGTKSMTIESEILDSTGAAPDGRVLARSRVVLVFFDLSTQRSVAPPAGYREAIAAVLGGPLTTPAAGS
ncbi:acyl-CoA thioesterase [Nocardioides sp. SYSU DS0651]|uniref:acyl-CoA thioesterase n=1 Tax=Nocardioides sp. SYSU DS0651 TaxID=3415955 RepID=UPI003F4C35EC